MSAPAMRRYGRRVGVAEKDVEALCDRLMQTCGFRVIRFSQARATMQTPGIPDRRYIHETLPLALWFEVKKPKGKWSPAQQAFAADCVRLGELYVVGTDEAARALLCLLGCWDGTALRPQGWREMMTRRDPTIHDRLMRLALVTQTEWR